MIQSYLFDFHGTLADVSSLHHLLAKKDYDGFYEGSLSCPPIRETVLSAQRTHDMGCANLLFTGMPNRYVDGLHAWLDRHEVPIDFVNMRPDGDYRKDFIIKREMYLAAVSNGYYVVRAWEDSPRVATLWESQGVPVTVVPGYVENLVIGGVDKASTTS